jgi:hypothetical protein
VGVGGTHIEVSDVTSILRNILSMVCILILEARTSSHNSLHAALKAVTFQLSWVFRSVVIEIRKGNGNLLKSMNKILRAFHQNR